MFFYVRDRKFLNLYFAYALAFAKNQSKKINDVEFDLLSGIELNIVDIFQLHTVCRFQTMQNYLPEIKKYEEMLDVSFGFGFYFR